MRRRSSTTIRLTSSACPAGEYGMLPLEGHSLTCLLCVGVTEYFGSLLSYPTTTPQKRSSSHHQPLAREWVVFSSHFVPALAKTPSPQSTLQPLPPLTRLT